MVLSLLMLLTAAVPEKATQNGPSLVIWLSALGTVLSIATAVGTFLWQIRKDKRAAALAETQQESASRSVSVDEIEAAIPGLGALVDRWRSEAQEAFKQIDSMRKTEVVDRERISDLELQVKVLKADLVAEKKKNIKLEERLHRLEGRTT